jgi:CDP-diacylglycerol--glycerol-3-phosphate 3-phosphatidyltransferase
MCWAVLSDIADGPIARRTRSRSRLGAALDPIADKLLIGSIVVTLVVVRSFPLWAALVIIFRDGCILLASAWLIKARKLVLESTALGKATGAALALMIGAYTLNLHLVSLLLTYLALFFVVVSSVSYLLRLKRLDQRRAV